jgi:tRNA(adenine34) deaminase
MHQSRNFTIFSSLLADNVPRSQRVPGFLPAGERSVILTSGKAVLIEKHERFMCLALDQAQKALQLGEVPVGAVLIRDDEVLGQGFNHPIRASDPTAHAELVALRQAARAVGNYRLPGSTLYVTVEPCLMCVGGLVQARVGVVVYGVAEPKFGAVESILKLREVKVPHRLTVVAGVLEDECRRLMQEFFKARRDGA